jgi:hypothetical protein
VLSQVSITAPTSRRNLNPTSMDTRCKPRGRRSEIKRRRKRRGAAKRSVDSPTTPHWRTLSLPPCPPPPLMAVVTPPSGLLTSVYVRRDSARSRSLVRVAQAWHCKAGQGPPSTSKRRAEQEYSGRAERERLFDLRRRFPDTADDRCPPAPWIIPRAYTLDDDADDIASVGPLDYLAVEPGEEGARARGEGGYVYGLEPAEWDLSFLDELDGVQA